MKTETATQGGVIVASDEASNENRKGIDNHIKAAEHLKEAASHHYEAAQHHKTGDHAKAAQSTILAHGHHSMAVEAEREDLKHHVVNG